MRIFVGLDKDRMWRVESVVKELVLGEYIAL
jgi:hypothetical protein